MTRIPPVILMGMHRSGTSMITRMLEHLGLFVGRTKEENHEATFFLDLNEWLLKQSGGAWDVPRPIRYLFEDEATKQLVTEYLEFSLNTPRCASYLGWGPFLRYRTPRRLPSPWGWKDPRNTFTLPLWLELFPNASVIYMERHGVDVANSLRRRQEKRRIQARDAFQTRRLLYRIVPKNKGFTHSLRCHDLEGSFSLWEEYAAEGRRHLDALGDRCLFVRYEDFLRAPESELRRIARFCGLTPSEERIVTTAARARPERAEAHQADRELTAFTERARSRLQRFGYG